jgi:transcriptional regulator with XRE-family HTH domain
VSQPDRLLAGLGAAVREARAARQLSQEELSLRTGVHRNYIGGIERAERSPSVVTIAKLADALGVSLSELVGRAERASR